VNASFAGPVIMGNPSQFNPATFLATPNNRGFYGNLGRDTFIGPWLGHTGLLFKDTRIRERLNLQFRAEFFNNPEQQFQHAERHFFHTVRCFADGWTDHE
jgi:hypothetical protein